MNEQATQADIDRIWEAIVKQGESIARLTKAQIEYRNANQVFIDGVEKVLKTLEEAHQ